jgi:hypothetical protein
MPSILAQDVPARSVKLSWIAGVRITKPCDHARLLGSWLFRDNTCGILRYRLSADPVAEITAIAAGARR